jgi:hypothetical protein
MNPAQKGASDFAAARTQLCVPQRLSRDAVSQSGPSKVSAAWVFERSFGSLRRDGTN